MANVSSWVESAFRLHLLLSSLGNRPLALGAFSWGTNLANLLTGLLCYPGTTHSELRSGTALYWHPPRQEPTESVSVASAADKNFTLLSCCCCLLILLLPEPNTHNRATSTQKKNSPRSRINPKCQSETAATICGAVTSNVKITQFHAHHHRPRFTRTSFRRPQKENNKRKNNPRRRGDSKSGPSFGPLSGPIRSNARVDATAGGFTRTIPPERNRIGALCSERERDSTETGRSTATSAHVNAGKRTRTHWHAIGAR